MKVACGLFQYEFELSGEWQAFSGWTERLREEGVQVECFFPHGSQVRSAPWIHHRTGEFWFRKAIEVWAFIREAEKRAHGVDAIHLFLPSPHFLWMSGCLRRKVKGPVIVTCLGERVESSGSLHHPRNLRDYLFRCARRFLMLILPKEQFSSDVYIVGSSSLKNQLIKAGSPMNRIHLISPLVPSERSPDPYTLNIAARLKELPTFLYIGHFLPNKGVDLLIEAFAQLVRDRRARLCLIWSGIGNARGIKRQLEYCRLPSSSILWVDRPIQRNAIFTAACALVQPWTVSFGQMSPPMVVLEAFRSGVPLIVSRLESLTDFGNSGETLYFADPLNTDILVRMMKHIMDHPDEGKLMRDKQRGLYKQLQPVTPLSHIYSPG